MADPKSTTPTGASKDNQPKVETPDPDLMSLEDLDKVIAESDPNAMKEIEVVRDIAAEIGKPLEVLEADFALDAENLPKTQNFKTKLKLKSIMLWLWLKTSTIEGAKKFGSWSIEKKKQVQEANSKMRHWPTQSKVLFYGAIFLAIGAIVFAYFAFVKKSLVYKQELFMASFEEMAQKKYDIAEDESRDTFYNSSKIPKNIFKLKKMVVNIQPSAGSGPNPMVAREFSREGGSSEALLEIKDREGEILDQVQRTVEGYSFDDLNEFEGKKELTEKVRSTVNRLLTLGKIRRVYIQGFILKP